MGVSAAAEEGVEGCGVRTSGAERVESFVGVDCRGEILVIDEGFDDSISGGYRDDVVCAAQLVEDGEGCGGDGGGSLQMSIERAGGGFTGRNAGGGHEGKKSERCFEVGGRKVRFEKSFVVVEGGSLSTVAKNTEDIGCEVEIAMTGGSVQDIQANTRR